MDGTPAATVTRSFWINSAIGFPMRWAPGKTALEPVSAQANGIPQQLTWNIGTTGSIVSFMLRPMLSFMQIPTECR